MNPMAMRWSRLYAGTAAELALEDAVAELGVPYRTQFPGFKYGVRFFPDFYLPTLRLVLEVDDRSHQDPEKQLADAERTRALRDAWGVQVARCTNEEALNDPRGAVRAMLSSVGLWPLPKHLPRLARALPALRKTPQKERRAARRRGASEPPTPTTHDSANPSASLPERTP
jgi:very-short-patch-repair endonuclease